MAVAKELTTVHETRLQQINAERIDAALHVFALLLFMLLGLLSLDRRELDSVEAAHAIVALHQLEGGPLPDVAPQTGHSVLRAFSYVAGATERSLRMPGIFALLLAGIILAAIAHRLWGPRARATTLFACCACGFVLHSARLDPELLAVLPAALLCALLLPNPRPWIWNCAAVAGAFLTPLLAPQLSPVVVLAAVFCALGVGARPRSVKLAFTLCLALYLPFLLGAPFTWPPAPHAPPDAPGLVAFFPGTDAGIEFLLTTLILGSIAYALGELRARPAAVLPLSMGLLAIVCTLAASGPLSMNGARHVVLMPVTALLLGYASAGAPPRIMRWLLLGALLVFAALLLRTLLFGAPIAASSTSNTAPLRNVLQAARSEGASGGRLILAGPDRFALLYYTRRGHDPAMPVLLCPEDVSEANLLARLEDALGVRPGTANAPPVLLWPRGLLQAPGIVERPLPGLGLAQLVAERQ